MTEASGREAVMTGGCQCGAVRYALYARPELHLCHCRMCQKAVGGPFAALAHLRKADFAWTRGTPGSFRSSSVAFRDFCPACGTPLTFRYTDTPGTNVTLGSLDRPGDLAPTAEHGIESRLPWCEPVGDLPSRRTEDDMPADRRARLVSFQHPDHDTPAGWRPPAGNQIP